MKAKELIKQLQQTSPEARVFIETEKGMHEFSLVSFDDVGDVNSCIISGDELA